MTTLLLSAAQTVIHLQCAVPFVLPQSAIDTNTRGPVSQIKAATKAGKAERPSAFWHDPDAHARVHEGCF